MHARQLSWGVFSIHPTPVQALAGLQGLAAPCHPSLSTLNRLQREDMFKYDLESLATSYNLTVNHQNFTSKTNHAAKKRKAFGNKTS
jgi:hypothetical protein